MEKYLRRCLDSLIIDEEGMKQLEVLVINDGSKDSSSQIAHEYQDKYPDTYRVIDKENGNYGSCINRGLKEATGKYVKVLDADDWFENATFNLFLKYIRKVDVDLILSSCIIVDEFGNKNGKFGVPFGWALKTYSIDTINNEKKASIQMHCVTYKTDIIKDINYVQLEGISYTDQLWVTYPMSVVKTYSVFDCNLYMYLVGRNGQTMETAVQNKKFNDEIKVTDQIISWIKESPKNNINYEFIQQKMISRIEYLYNNHCNLGLYDEKEFRAFANHLKYEIPEIMEITESRCGNNNEENFILKYNNSSLSIVGDIKERQNLDKSKNGSILKKGIKKFLKTINYLILTYNV